MRVTNQTIVVGLAGLILGLLLGWGVPEIFYDPSLVHTEGYTREGGYEFINPLIACNLREDLPFSGFNSLKSEFESQIATHIKNGDATKIAVTVRDMDRGYWTGVNQFEKFIPASLDKVPYMIALFREVRDVPNLLSEQKTLTQALQSDVVEHYQPSERLDIGRSYTLEQLMTAMITRSDNDALNVIADTVQIKTLEDVYSNFDVVPPTDATSRVMSPDLYLRFFWILYNSSYLGRNRSQEALRVLSQSEFTDGLVSGVPAGTTVSHKFGERTEGVGAAQRLSLHDCGIVYYPHAPYGICVMTEGTDFDRLSAVIAHLSNVTYTAVQKGLFTNEPPDDY